MKKGWEFEQARKEEQQQQKEAEDREQRNAAIGCFTLVAALLFGAFLFVAYNMSFFFAPTHPSWIRYLLGAGVGLVIMVVLIVVNVVVPGDFGDQIVRILVIAGMIGDLAPVFVRARDNAQRHQKAIQQQATKRAP